MKKDNLKQTAKSVRKIKPLAKGVILKSVKKENGLRLYGFAARMVKRLKSYGFYRKTKPRNDTSRETEKLITSNINWNFKRRRGIFESFVL